MCSAASTIHQSGCYSPVLSPTINQSLDLIIACHWILTLSYDSDTKCRMILDVEASLGSLSRHQQILNGLIVNLDHA